VLDVRARTITDEMAIGDRVSSPWRQDLGREEVCRPPFDPPGEGIVASRLQRTRIDSPFLWREGWL
jgi:hypothetical protein